MCAKKELLGTPTTPPQNALKTIAVCEPITPNTNPSISPVGRLVRINSTVRAIRSRLRGVHSSFTPALLFHVLLKHHQAVSKLGNTPFARARYDHSASASTYSHANCSASDSSFGRQIRGAGTR